MLGREFKKSSFSDIVCVEVALLDDGGRVAVRHSKSPDSVQLTYTRDEWNAFILGVKQGEFDHPDR